MRIFERWYFGLCWNLRLVIELWYLERFLREFSWRLYFCVLKYLNFHNSSFPLRFFFDVNGKAMVWQTPCWLHYIDQWWFCFLILSWVAPCLSRLSTLLLLLPLFSTLFPHFLCVRTFDANVFDLDDEAFEQSVLKVLGFYVVTFFLSLSLSLSLRYAQRKFRRNRGFCSII